LLDAGTLGDATLWRGGVVWRGTFYPIDELRKGLA
jgi:hypothetical protein